MALAAPVLSNQWGRTLDAWTKLSALSVAERELKSDPVAVEVARDIAEGVPAEACVAVLAYAGADAATYYRGRLAYLLYPRKVRLYPRSDAAVGDCEHVAVFRDTSQNLRASPFAGRWNQQELDQRLSSLELIQRGGMARVFRAGKAQDR